MQSKFRKFDEKVQNDETINERKREMIEDENLVKKERYLHSYFDELVYQHKILFNSYEYYNHESKDGVLYADFSPLSDVKVKVGKQSYSFFDISPEIEEVMTRKEYEVSDYNNNN